MEEVSHVEFIQICGVLERQSNPTDNNINIKYTADKLPYHWQGRITDVYQIREATNLNSYDVFSGERFICQQVSETFGFNVELLNSLWKKIYCIFKIFLAYSKCVMCVNVATALW